MATDLLDMILVYDIQEEFANLVTDADDHANFTQNCFVQSRLGHNTIILDLFLEFLDPDANNGDPPFLFHFSLDVYNFNEAKYLPLKLELTAPGRYSLVFNTMGRYVRLRVDTNTNVKGRIYQALVSNTLTQNYSNNNLTMSIDFNK